MKHVVIEHWDKIIEFAKSMVESNVESVPSVEEMYDAIGTHWHGSECLLCKLYSKRHCEECPIFEKTNQYFCCGTPWENVNKAMTWKEFLQFAIEEKAFLETIEFC